MAHRFIRLPSRLAFCGILLATGLSTTGTQGQIREKATIVYLVRHAEKLDDSTDSPLTTAGRERAELLSEILQDAGLTHIHTTDFERTRDTAEPISERLSIQPRLYDARELPGLADRLRATPGRHLVSGHSNSTPSLVRLLGGESTDIPESEYDRLYIVTLDPDGTASTVLLRYGSP
jgi:phosphohistidine phosphatase SixA